MKVPVASKNKWPLMSAAIISDTNNLHMHLRELIRGMGWRMDDPPASADVALAYVQNGTSFFFIAEDNLTISAYESIRTVINHPVGRLTPILILLLENSVQDAAIYQKVLHVGVAPKPLTPNRFLPIFKDFFNKWESPIYMLLRRCGYLILNGDEGAAIDALTKLNTVPQAIPYATQTLVRLLTQQEEWKKAEAIVLGTIKQNPRLPSLMLTVANFYIDARMPAQALRFYMKLKNICGNSPIFSFDIAQAALALGHLDVAIEAFSEWLTVRPGSEQVVSFLGRLFMAEGRDSQLERLFNANRASIKRIQDVWEKAENPALQTIHSAS